ncbi:MAG: hypothetical protein U9R05_02150 [Chloroflexota bacterium]|nr:hypothetical protein [Chloroflexota bacterium]
MRKDTDLMSYGEAFEQVLSPLEGPIAADDLITQILTLRPSTAKKPRAAVRAQLRKRTRRGELVFLDSKTILPGRLAMQGVRFAVPLGRQEVKRGVLFISPAFPVFLRSEISPEEAQLEDESGRLLPVKIVTGEKNVKTIFGTSKIEYRAFELSDWFHAHHIRRKDYILVTVEDWERGHFRLEHETARQRKRHQEEIDVKNQELSDLLFEQLEAARNESIYVNRALPTAFARMSTPRGYPGDHWFLVIAADPRMQAMGSSIRYADWSSPLDDILKDVYEKEPPPSQVYRFKAALKYRKGLWRRIEIRGEQTLADFDYILRTAFEHDPGDHLSGFWKRVRRGKGRRYREISLGNTNPFGEGETADLSVAGLQLQPGDELKYVYDFGDWIEHLITLEELVEPEEGVKYPRVVAQNRPRHRYCESCKAEGRKTIATWICLDCASREKPGALVCEDCLMKYHEDHYAEEVLY